VDFQSGLFLDVAPESIVRLEGSGRLLFSLPGTDSVRSETVWEAELCEKWD